MKGFSKLASPSFSERRELRKVFRKFNKRGNLRRNFPAIAEAAKIQHWEPLPEPMPEAMQLELERSAIDSEIAALNFKSLSSNEAFEYLLYSDKISRRNDGRLRDGDMRRYSHLADGGWWCSGINILTGSDSLWGCFKANKPRADEANSKLVKYEHPPKVDTEIFALRIPARIWELIGRRYDVALPENYQSLPYGDFWRWVRENTQIPIITCEGAKKAAAILSCGYVAIALPGVRGGYRQPKNEYGEISGAPYLIPQLAIFAQPGRRIYFCFDADVKRTTVRDVNQAIAKTAKLLSLRGCEVKVMGWHPALGKGIDDVLAACGRKQFDTIYCDDAQDLIQWNTKQLRRLTYTPDLSLNQRYLGELAIPSGKQLIALKSPKNTGKTHFFQWITDPVIRSGEKKVLVITHRVQLGTQIVNKLGLPFITELREAGQGSHFGMGLVIDSLHPKSQAKFNPDEWKGCWLILDEIMQLIWHLLSSSTCESDRVAIIKNFKKLLLNVVNYGGKIFIADADLNDSGIDFIQGLIGQNIDTFLVENTFKFVEPWQVKLVQGKNPAQLVKILTQKLEDGKKCFVCLSGQRANSRWGSRNLESYYKKLLPHLRILRIDSKSTTTIGHPAFGCTDDLNEVVKNYDLVLTTSTIETGVSIEEKHFDYVFGIFQGVQTTDGVRQHLSRYRPPVPRYIWLNPVGINKVGNGSNSVKALLSGEYRKNKANVKRLIGLGLEETIEGTLENICLDTWGRLGAIINDGMSRYSQQIISDLKDEGHIICEVSADELADPTEIENTKEAIDDNCKEEYAGHCKDVPASESITDEQFLKLSKQACKNELEQLQHRKGELERRYNTPVTPELVEKDDKGWYSLIRLHYYLGLGREFLPDREINVMSTALKNGDGDYFIPDTNKKFIVKKIDALDWINYQELLETDGLNNNHPLAKAALEKVKTHQYDLSLILGAKSNVFGKLKTPMQVCQKLASLTGYKFPRLRREGIRGNQVWIYGVAAPDFQKDDDGNLVLVDGRAVPVSDRREEVFTAWVERDILAREKAATAKLDAQAIILSSQSSPVAETNPLSPLQEQKMQTVAVELQPALPTLEEIKLAEIEACKLEANAQINSHLSSWVGLKLKLQQGLQDAGKFYQETVSEIGEAIGIAEGEPFWNAFLSRWHIAVSFTCGSKSVACDWVAIA
ncbi:MAG: plasmid replication protein, CyRepA1 family [Nostoc sp.]